MSVKMPILSAAGGIRLALVSLAASLVLGGSLEAQAPTIEKVDPPSWWAGHSINPVRVLVRGKHLAGARIACPHFTCTTRRVSASATYAFVDVTVPKTLAPGTYPFTLRTSAGSAQFEFTINAPLARADRFKGFDANDVIYLIMPDRFADGDTTNDDPAASPGILDRKNLHRYHGGDLAGVQARLPYLKELGVTAIWLTPIFDNTNVLDHKEVYGGDPTTAYHGYHAIDYYAVDEHFGTVDDYRKLVDAAHARGIKVIMDLVANHTSAYHPWVADSPTPTWYNGTAAKHLANTWQTWTLADSLATPAMKKATLDGWFIDILPDLNQNDPEVARYITQNTLWWVGVSGIDGIRQDTWPYVPRAFWRDWMTAIKREYPKLRVVGEVLDGDPTLVSFFQGGRARYDGVDDKVDALFDYPLHYTIRSAFAQGKSLRDVSQMLGRDRLYPNANALVTLFGSHDVPRFMSETGATTKGLELAFTFLLTSRGTPLVYYGDEIAMPGGGDPENRRDFPGGWASDKRDAFMSAGRSKDEQEVWAHVQKLLQLRSARPDLRTGAMQHLYASDQQFVYKRGKTVIALNNDTTAATVILPAMTLPEDALGVCSAPAADSGGVTIVIPARSGCVF
ncbi:MAG TPA: alpha-amylase family glycosyl hydrolase [Gemmatimonadaceae bacterium]|nr:alpha-amylase family glycosyl hydrolase [Gemmatimonadaceae bacterium]